MSKLFSPVQLGALSLSHRLVHPPMTRLRAEPDDTPSAMMVEYYRQRATQGGLIITESAHPSSDSRGYIGAPGIYTDRHVEGWRRVIDAVHGQGGRIVMQIAHDGRQSHVDLSNGAPPIAPSVVPFEGQAFTANGWVPVSVHRALKADEIPALVESFRRGDADLVAIGRWYSSNPDRLRRNLPLVIRDGYVGALRSVRMHVSMNYFQPRLPQALAWTAPPETLPGGAVVVAHFEGGKRNGSGVQIDTPASRPREHSNIVNYVYIKSELRFI